MTIQAVKIEITRAEGPAELCGETRTFEGGDCWRAASSWLRGQSYTFPRTLGYDKHDFRVTWADGETYEGRLDCKHVSCEDPGLDVAAHVRAFCEFYAGLRRPAWMDDEQWEGHLRRTAEDRPAFQDFLEKYAIPEGRPRPPRASSFYVAVVCVLGRLSGFRPYVGVDLEVARDEVLRFVGIDPQNCPWPLTGRDGLYRQVHFAWYRQTSQYRPEESALCAKPPGSRRGRPGGWALTALGAERARTLVGEVEKGPDFFVKIDATGNDNDNAGVILSNREDERDRCPKPTPQ